MMNVNEPDKNKPVDFSSLPQIMEHFFRVPFPQFESDLNDWFKRNMQESDGLTVPDKKQQIDVSNHFLSIAQKIFDAAEEKPVK